MHRLQTHNREYEESNSPHKPLNLEYDNVKKLFCFILTALTITHPAIYADIDPDDVGSEKIDAPITNAESGPFTIHLQGDYIGKTKIKDSYGFHKLSFGTAEAQASMVFYYDECLQEGANIELFYENTMLDWDNPYFDQSDYSTVGFALGGFSKRLTGWTWTGQVIVNFDNLKYWNFSDYMYYDFFMWGRYELCHNLGAHIGFYAETGMKVDRVYPIIGIDWVYNCNWKINAIFPMNMSIVYTLNPNWSFALAARIFDERNRVGNREFLSRGLWHYQSSGAEFGAYYKLANWLSANIHAGYTIGGHLKVSDRNNNHGHRFRLEPAPYAGGDVSVNF